MRFHRTVVLALLVGAIVTANRQNASAQFVRSKNVAGQQQLRQVQQQSRHVQQQARQAQRPVRQAQHTSVTSTSSPAEELPMGHRAPEKSRITTSPAPYMGEEFSGGHFSEGSHAFTGGYPACCEGYDGTAYDCGAACGCGDACCNDRCCSQWFVTGEYLYTRAHFSDALSFVEQVQTQDVNATLTQQTFHQFDFDYESSFRVGGGWRNCCCGDEIRVNYSRLSSSAQDAAFPAGQGSGILILVPYTEVPIQAADSITMAADVDVNTFDIEYRKTIPLGGNQGSSCGDCCNECCEPDCPAWDITWSGGVRGADVEWNRAYGVVNGVAGQVTINTLTNSELNFSGAGPRIGVEGRRYFGCQGWCSIFMQGNLSLLLGDLELRTTQFSADITDDDRLVESLDVNEVIPVTEIELGASANLTCHSAFTAGYMWSAWHDLGFRGEALLPEPLLNRSYDDANILSFDGFFARLEWSY
jgi:hypothetical protein